MAFLTLNASDGHQLGAYRAAPHGNVRGAIVVVQEIFGVNSHIRSICDRLAKLGYVAIAPALFDRIEPDFQSGYLPHEVELARGFIAKTDWDALMRDVEAARLAVSDQGKVWNCRILSGRCGGLYGSKPDWRDFAPPADFMVAALQR